MTSFLQISLLRRSKLSSSVLVQRRPSTNTIRPLFLQQQPPILLATTTNVRSFSATTGGSGSGGHHNDKNHQDGGGRSNFDRDVLLPASRGELGIRNTGSMGGGGGGGSGGGIPKLAARRNKPNLYAGAGSNASGAASSASALNYDDDSYGEAFDEDHDVDPNNPFNDRHLSTMTMITNTYQPSSSSVSYSSTGSTGSNIDRDDGNDADQNYVLLNADVISPTISDDARNNAEQELEYLTHVLLKMTRDVAELAILEATEQQQQSQKNQNQDPAAAEENEKRKNIILQQLQATEYRVMNETKSFGGTNTGSTSSISDNNNNNKYTTNGILNSSLQYAETNLIHGIQYDGSPSMKHYNINECHTNPYLPYNKYYKMDGLNSQQLQIASGGSSNKVDSNNNNNNNNTPMLNPGSNRFNNTQGLENIDLEMDNSTTTNALIDTPEAQMIHRETIVAYAKVLELDMDFGYWNEMDYDYLLPVRTDGSSGIEQKSLSELDELNQYAKEELKKKEAIVQILQEAASESDTDIINNDDEDLATLVDGKEGSSSDIKNSSGGKGNMGVADKAVPALSPQEQESNDFVAWFCKKNSTLEYEHDPALMTAQELQNLSPMVRKRMQDMGINLNETIDPNDVGDNRDEMFEGHPHAVELCSGSEEVIHVEAPHPHQLRRPKLTYRTNIKQPDELFLNHHRRFAYVNNIPPIYLESNDSKLHPPKLIDINNPVDRTFFQRNVANMMNIDNIDQIYPASTTSAYIGFKDAIGLATVLMNGPNYEVVQQIEEKIPPPFFEVVSSDNMNHKIVISANEKKPDSDKCMLQLSNLETSGGTRYTSVSLAKALFSSSNGNGNNKETSLLDDIGIVAYGNVTADNIQFVNATTAIIQFASAEQAASVLDSEILRIRLRGLNSRLPTYMSDSMISNKYNNMNQRLEVFRARRELVHRGWDTTRGRYRGSHEEMKFGNRLIVDGDMPTKDFYTSHAAVVMLTGVDPTITSKLDISNLVQPYCSLQRDVEGSIQWVECNYTEQRTDRVYVGFDLVGDAEAFVKAIGGTTNALYKNKDKHRRATTIKLLRDRQPPNYTAAPLQRRPDRPIEEILQQMNNWEQYVEVADIEYLEKHGISKHILDEALRAIRYNNESFGAFDAAVSTETLEPAIHQTPGQKYRDLVQLYVSTLKECVATPEKPGEIFTMLQFPNDEPDLGYFDYETKRLERIKNERIGSGINS